MGYRLRPFTMSVRNNSTQEFEDVNLLASDNLFKIKTVTGTPNTYGAISLDLTTGIVLCVTCSATSNVMCTVYRNGTDWYCKCTNMDDGTAATSSVTLQVYYTTLTAST